MDASRNLLATRPRARTQQELNAILLAHEIHLLHRPGGAPAQLAASDMSGLNFAQRDLTGADLSGATLFCASLARTKLVRANLYCADLRLADLRHADMSSSDMRGASLRGANLSCAILDHADLRAATMARAGTIAVLGSAKSGTSASSGAIGVDFSNCSMKRASLSGATLKGVNFNGALLQGADFKGAKLVDVTFKDAVLTDVNLKDLNVDASVLAEAVTEPTPTAEARIAELKSRLDIHQLWIGTGGREGMPAVLDGEDLRPLQSHLAGRHLTGLSARQAIGIGVNFAGCHLEGARFDGADLRDADFSDADLRAASFRAAKLTHARFTSADLRPLVLLDGRKQGVDLWEAVAEAHQFAGAQLDDTVAELGFRPQTDERRA